jgi:hypothetical protein
MAFRHRALYQLLRQIRHKRADFGCRPATLAGTLRLRKQLEGTIDEYLIKERSRIELAASMGA